MCQTIPKLTALNGFAALAVALCTASPMLAEDRVIDVDFDGASPGQPPPSLAYLDDASDGEVRIVDSTTTPADPFGGEANRSLYVIDSGDDEQMPRFAWNTGEPIEKRGRLSLKFYHPGLSEKTGASPALISLTLGQQRRDDEGRPGVVVDGGPSILFRTDGRIRYTTHTDTGRRVMPQFDQSFPRKAVHTFVVDFDLEKQQWSATLDGIRLTNRAGHRNSFPFRKAFLKEVERVDAIQLRVGRWRETDQHVFFDDIVLTANPEPEASQNSDADSRLATSR